MRRHLRHRRALSLSTQIHCDEIQSDSLPSHFLNLYPDKTWKHVHMKSKYSKDNKQRKLGNKIYPPLFSLFSRCWTCCICPNSDTGASVTLMLVIRSGSQSSSSQRCWTWLRSGLCADQWSSSTPNWENHVFMELLCALAHRHVKTGKKQTQTVDTKLDVHSYHIILCGSI